MSLHCTSVSAFQPVSNRIPSRPDFSTSTEINTGVRIAPDLPAHYKDVLPLYLSRKVIYAPKTNGVRVPPIQDDLFKGEMEWLEHVYRSKLSSSDTSSLSWAAFHSAQQRDDAVKEPWINVIMPILPDEAHTPAIARHGFKIAKSLCDHLNPGYIPVLTVDQPIYTNAKFIQWKYPNDFGEDKYFVMLGGLHIELATVRMIGDYFRGSGWSELVAHAEVTTSGVADSCLKAANLGRAKYMHEVSVCALYISLKQAYTDYQNNFYASAHPPLVCLRFDGWIREMKEKSAQFFYWYTGMELELLLLTMITSERAGLFEQYCRSLRAVVKWFFTFNHVHYARWLSVHIRDLDLLPQRNPKINRLFSDGYFVLQKSRRKFSGMGLDQAHEQNNATLKSDGGVPGLTTQEDQLVKWSLWSPEVLRVCQEFEKSLGVESTETIMPHHECTVSHQKLFDKHVSQMVSAVGDCGNPFSSTTNELYRIHTGDLLDENSIKCLRSLENLGETQYTTFVKERLIDRKKPITDAIERNRIQLFEAKPVSRTKLQKDVVNLRQESRMFSRMYVSCQSRNADLGEFFRHENQQCPPSLSTDGHLRSGCKADLVKCLEDLVDTVEARPNTDVTIIDGPALINQLGPKKCKNAVEYAESIVVPTIQTELRHSKRVDCVFDEYIVRDGAEASLKLYKRNQRSATKHIDRKFTETIPIVPSKWQENLRSDVYKSQLFPFLARKICDLKLPSGQLCITTVGAKVLSTSDTDISGLQPCDHAEADTRVFVHALDAFKKGARSILIKTADTDIVVIAVAFVSYHAIPQLWVAFGTGKDFRYVAVHKIARALGQTYSAALPFFHAFTGCDTVSFINRIGKKTAWKIFRLDPSFAKLFASLTPDLTSVPEKTMSSIERFTILLFARSSNETCIDSMRRELFTDRGLQITNLPPTKAALVQHTNRAIYPGKQKAIEG